MKSFLSRVQFVRDHRWTPPRMSAYLDGELDERQRDRFDRHVRECARCRRLLAGLAALVDNLRRVSAAGGGDPAQIASAVRARVRELPGS